MKYNLVSDSLIPFCAKKVHRIFSSYAWQQNHPILCNFQKPGDSIIYASNEPKSVLARDLGDCRDNLRNSRSVFLIVFLL